MELMYQSTANLVGDRRSARELTARRHRMFTALRRARATRTPAPTRLAVEVNRTSTSTAARAA